MQRHEVELMYLKSKKFSEFANLSNCDLDRQSFAIVYFSTLEWSFPVKNGLSIIID